MNGGNLPSDLPASYRNRGVRRPSVSAEVITEEQSRSFRATRYPKSEEAIATIRGAVQDNFLFEGLSYKQLFDVIECMLERKVSADEEVMRQGEEGDNFYVVTEGTFDAIKDGTVVFTYSGKGAFGELALMYNCPRAATVVARSQGTLWALDRATFTNMLVAERRRRALASDAWLSRVPILDYLSKTDVARLADALLAKQYSEGETIFSQGDVGNMFFIVEEGEAKGLHLATEDGSVREMAVFREGDYFGERALIVDEPRALTVVASTPLKVMCLDAPAFERILGPCKHAMQERINAYESLVAAQEAGD